MTESIAEPSTSQTAAAPLPDLLGDRRRPGRAPVSPTLLPLLRGDAIDAETVQQADIDLPAIEWEAEDSMKPARGIALGLLLSLPIWGAFFAVYHEIAVHLAPHP